MDVAIAGAGISGLTAAISLRRSGHRVTIYERSLLNNEVGAALNVGPNVSCFLRPWGLDPSLAGFVQARAFYFFSPFTLQQEGEIDLSSCPGRHGGPMYFAHRADLHETLKRLATETEGPGVPVRIRPLCAVVSYDPEAPSMTLADGSNVTADLIVAADGVHTSAARAVTGEPAVSRTARHLNCAYRFVIPTSHLEANPATSWFVHKHPTDGGRVYPDLQGLRRLVAYPCRNLQIMNFVILCRNNELHGDSEDWQASVDKSEALDILQGYHPGLLDVVKEATEVKRWPLLYRPPLRTWHKGRIALVGDAAHPMLPHLGQGGAQAIEDGLALGLAMHGVTQAAQIPERLAVYQQVRYSRASAIQILSNSGVDEEPPVEARLHMQGRPVPGSAKERIRFAFDWDVVEETAQRMLEIDPTFRVPDSFFPGTET